MKEKVKGKLDPLQVDYDDDRWSLFRWLRAEASGVQNAIEQESFIYGSLARGDVKKGSDIDIVIPRVVASFKIEIELEKAGFVPSSREIVKANPNSVPKAHIHLNDYTTITFPLAAMSELEEDFYRFGGLVTGKEEARVPGVDKRLLLITPTGKGHVEEGIIGSEASVAKLLGVGVDIVNERIRVLTRRDRVGRTGTYLKRDLSEDETFEEVLKYLEDRDSVVRRHLRIKR
jgi:predicted nucleotidyltransferase